MSCCRFGCCGTAKGEPPSKEATVQRCSSVMMVGGNHRVNDQNGGGLLLGNVFTMSIQRWARPACSRCTFVQSDHAMPVMTDYSMPIDHWIPDLNPVESTAPSHPGLTVWFTGLSSSGKTTLSQAVYEQLAASGHRVELLDGDEVRLFLSRGLGFSKQDRDENVRRIGYVAELLTRHG